MKRAVLLSLVGSAVLAGFSIAALPFSRGFFRAPRTPYDAGDASFAAPAWILLVRAEPLVPRNAYVLVRSEPVDLNLDTYLHRFAVALLPGRQIVPAARWGVASEPKDLEIAEYEVVVGRAPTIPPGRLLLEAPEGTVWRRER
ncbi:MAG TPA: hypothetical protein VLG15_03730 [Thermoanaerobaculia bacterium]|nr:hypothetical protein [Thermoanaerobaculia bacterium]